MFISLDSLNKYVGEEDNRLHILKDISLHIERGEFIAIVGRSGSGKSTLMNILGCLDLPSAGSYLLDGADIQALSSHERARLRSKRFGFVFQRYNLLAALNSLENVALPGIYAGIPHAERMQRAHDLLLQFELSDKEQAFPNKLSGGEQQRVSIARALMNGGEVILADEPTGALDSQSGENVLEILKELNQKGHTVILVTHDRSIASHARRIIELQDGKIVSDSGHAGAAAQILSPEYSHDAPTTFAVYKDQLFESFTIAVQAIFSHKMRSALTMLGIIIGIASVISVVALGRGSQEKIIAEIRSMGTNTIDIFPGKNFGDLDAWRIKTLTVDDAAMLAAQHFVASVTPNTIATGTVVYGNSSASATLNGANEQYFSVKELHTMYGHFFTKYDVENNASVVVMDQNAKNVLFPPGVNPVGSIILFNNQPLEVVGVTDGKNKMLNQPGTINLWSPYTTVMYKISGQRGISSITVKVSDRVLPQIAEKNISELLAVKHGGVKDFFTFNTDSIRKTVESATNTLRLLVAGIALISLVVGGIGIMNIMLVSVTERTREIGIRMAIGANRRSILTQFLIEAVLVSLMGAVIGIVLSFSIGLAMDFFVTSVQMAYSMASIVLALCCSTAIGIVFGFIPARNASRLNPIDALARE